MSGQEDDPGPRRPVSRRGGPGHGALRQHRGAHRLLQVRHNTKLLIFEQE